MERQWFVHRVESLHLHQRPDEAQRLRLLRLLSQSEVFDHFMQKRFTQVKRYGLEGAESMMVALDQIFAHSSHCESS